MRLFNIFLWIVILENLFGERYSSFLFIPPFFHTSYVWWLALGVDKKKRKLIFVGASAIYWALWLSSNDMVFDKSPSISYMQVIFRQHIGSDFGHSCKSLMKMESSWRLHVVSLRRRLCNFLPTMDGDSQIDLNNCVFLILVWSLL